MRLENIVWDADDPRRLGAFWATALGARLITDGSELVEARLELGPDHFLDLCFPRVESPGVVRSRLVPQLGPGQRGGGTAESLVSLGALPDDNALTTMAEGRMVDPEGHPFGVVLEVEHDQGAGPIISLQLESADPPRDAHFWAAITGDREVVGNGSIIRHASPRVPVIELQGERTAKTGKNPVHVHVRAEPGERDPVGRALSLGAVLVSESSGLPWVVMADPSGNEFCILDAT